VKSFFNVVDDWRVVETLRVTQNLRLRAKKDQRLTSSRTSHHSHYPTQDSDSNRKRYILQTDWTSYNMSSTTAITEVDLSKYNIKKIASGKVREIFEIDEKTLLFVATDRISAYDVILNNVSPLFLSFDGLLLLHPSVRIPWNYTFPFPPSIYPMTSNNPVNIQYNKDIKTHHPQRKQTNTTPGRPS
jgi:hypothetical protein